MTTRFTEKGPDGKNASSEKSGTEAEVKGQDTTARTTEKAVRKKEEKESRKKKPSTLPRFKGEAVLISLSDKKEFPSLVEKIKKGTAEPEGIQRIRRTREGDLLFKFNPGVETKEFRKNVTKFLDEGKRPKRLSPKMELEILDIEPTENKDSILKAANEATEAEEGAIQCSGLRRCRDGTMTVYMKCDADVGEKLLKNKVLKLGWTRCRVRKAPDILRCFRCHGFSHIARNCKFKKDVCRRCGQEGHTFRDCKAENPERRLCKLQGRGKTEHITGSFNCPVYKEEIGATRRVTEGSKPMTKPQS